MKSAIERPAIGEAGQFIGVSQRSHSLGATAAFSATTDRLIVESFATVDLTAAEWPVFDIVASAINYPFLYDDRDWTDLGALVAQQYVEPDGELQKWARAFVAGRPTDTLSLLKHISLGIASTISYESREEEGTQDHSIRSTEAGVRAGISLFFSLRRLEAWALEPASFPVTSSTRT